jgi:hypothetical protein
MSQLYSYPSVFLSFDLDAQRGERFHDNLTIRESPNPQD